MKKRPKIYLAGGFTWLNKGDAALVLSLVAAIRKKIPDGEFILTSVTPEIDKARFAEFGISVVAYPFIPWGGFDFNPLRRWLSRHGAWRLPQRYFPDGTSPAWISARKAALGPAQFLHSLGQFVSTWWNARIRKRPIASLFGPDFEESVEALSSSDAVVFVPGGYLMAFKPSDTYWYRNIFPAFIAYALKKPVLIAPISAGPFVGFLNRLTARAAFRIPELIQLREELSRKHVESEANSDRISITTDAAFALPPSASSVHSSWLERIRGSDRLSVGISLRDYNFPESDNPKATREAYIGSFARLLDYLSEHYEADVYFAPQNHEGKRDIAFSRSVAAEAETRDNLHFIDEDLDPFVLRDIYGACDVFIGVRMHANIFAMSRFTPTLAIAYQGKTHGIMTALGLPDLVLDIYHLDGPTLIQKFDYLYKNRVHIENKLEQTVPQMSKTVESALDELTRVLVEQTHRVHLPKLASHKNHS